MCVGGSIWEICMSKRIAMSAAAVGFVTVGAIAMQSTIALAEAPQAVSPQREAAAGPLSPVALQDAFAKVAAERKAAEEEAARKAEEERLAREAAEAAAAQAAAEAQAKAAAEAAAAKAAAAPKAKPAASSPTSSGAGTTDYSDNSNGDVASWAASAKAQSVIRCESGGNYSINTGNGYYGAWQFNYSSWHANGGGAYAQYPHQATKAQQDQVAYNYYQKAGWRPWACA